MKGVNIAALAAMLASALAACDDRQAFAPPEPSWERMLEQPKAKPYRPTPFYDGTSMREPPRGTVPYGEPADAVVETGIDGDAYAARVPIALDERALLRGQTEFNVFCAACHGVAGDGVSAVAPNMTLRRPPSLHEARIRAYPPGRIFEIATEGYGLMPSYRAELSTEERWDVVAYVQALQLSQHVATADLAPVDREALAKQEQP